ncbi:MAG: hypothetical protein K8T25_11420 [Planctomycetia bacterium]|nr:hypothetical protein [Planctomycetia bacterium]
MSRENKSRQSAKVLCVGDAGKIEIQKMVQSPFGLLSPKQFRRCTPAEIAQAQKRAVQKSVADDPNECFDAMFFGPEPLPVKVDANKSARTVNDPNEQFDSLFPWQRPDGY